MAPEGECYVYLPVWMHHALNHGVFDNVVLPTVPRKLMIKAGEPVGFLGAQDSSDNRYPSERLTEYQAHIELLSTDEQVPDILANVAGIKTGRQYVKLKLKRPLYLRHGDGNDTTFSQMSAVTRKDGDKILSREATHPFTDKNGVTWFQIRAHAWMHQDDVEQLSQHDLAGLNFRSIVGVPTTDLSRPFDESWAIEAVKSIAAHFDSEKGPDSSQAKMFFDGLIRQLRARDAGGMTEWHRNELNKELFAVLHSPHMAIPELMRRLVVKHDSEWHGGRDDPRWSALFSRQPWEPMNDLNKHFLQVHEWMHQVPPFADGRPVWHFHPLEFLAALHDKAKRIWAHSPFANLLGQVESKNDYTAYNRTYPHPNPSHTEAHYKTNLTSMTISEGIKEQTEFRMFATGRFQIIPGTLKEAVKKLNLDVKALYNEVIQDKIFEDYIIKVKRPKIIAYLEGNGSVEDTIYDWAKEFASAGVRKGKKISKGKIAQIEGMSYYSGDGLNTAHLKPDDMVLVLKESKNGNN